MLHADVNGDALPDAVMISRTHGDLGLPTQVTVAEGRGDSWGAPRMWYASAAATNISGSCIYALADLNDDELSDLVVINGLDVLVAYSSGSAFVPPAVSSSSAPAPLADTDVSGQRSRRSLRAASALQQTSANEEAMTAHGVDTLHTMEQMRKLQEEGAHGPLGYAPDSFSSTSTHPGKSHARRAASSNAQRSPGNVHVEQRVPLLISKQQALVHISSDLMDAGHVQYISYAGGPQTCTAASALHAWPAVASECSGEEHAWERTSVSERAASNNGTHAPAGSSASTTAELGGPAQRRSLQQGQQAEHRRWLQASAASARAHWLGSLPDTLLDCTLARTGLSLVQNLPGHQLLFACRAGACSLLGMLLRCLV